MESFYKCELNHLKDQLFRAKKLIEVKDEALTQAWTLLSGMIEVEKLHPHECRNTHQKIAKALALRMEDFDGK